MVVQEDYRRKAPRCHRNPSPEIGRIGPRQNREVFMPYISIVSVIYAKNDVASRTFVGTNPMFSLKVIG